MKFVVGIGNPERKYDGTRHNAGFEVVDGLASMLGAAKKWKEVKRLRALAAEVDGGLLVKPLTYVNLSGESVQGIVREYHPEPKDLLVVCDDVNLDFGKLRLRAEGSAGGHHALESIIGSLAGREDFPRLRFGVRNADMPKDLNGFVLEPFGRDEREKVGALQEKAVSVCASWLKEDFDSAVKMLSQLQGK